MDPNDLRDCVEKEIKELIEPVAWNRCEVINQAEQESLQDDPRKSGVRHDRAQPSSEPPTSRALFLPLQRARVHGV